MVMKKLNYILLSLTVLLAACSKDKPQLNQLGSNEQLTVQNSGLSDRISLVHEVVEATPVNMNFEKSGGDVEEQSGILWEYVADLNTLKYQGQTLSATHIVYREDLAVVSYNVQGSTHLGAVEILDLSDKDYPEVLSTAFFGNADVNSIAFGNGAYADKVWLAISHAKKGAILGEVSIVADQISSEYRYINLSNKIDGSSVSASANSIAQKGNMIYVTSGKSTGGVFCVDASTFSYLGGKSFSNAKSVAISGGDRVVALASSENSQLHFEDYSYHSFESTKEIGQIYHQNVDEPYKGKASLHFSETNPDVCFVTMAQNGLKGYNVQSGELVFSTSSNMLKEGNTNGVTSDEDYIYVANGADGLMVLDNDLGLNSEPMFQWDLADETGASANFVQSFGQWIFVAKGGGGVKILRKRARLAIDVLGPYDKDGKPTDMVSPGYSVCNTFLEKFFSEVLPERQNALTTHPEYFERVSKEISITKDCQLYTTHIFEGAGYKNTVGYYYYDENNPPATEADVNRIVIFPNNSSENSGGALEPGNTMKLIGNFKAGTKLGFFVIANGWDKDKFEITNGHYTLFTNPDLNQNNYQQHLFFRDTECDAHIICFEDIRISGGDKDYNDAVFMLNTVPKGALNVDEFIEY